MRAATVHLGDVDPASPGAVEAVDHYFAELDRRFPTGFDATEARADDAVAMAPGRGTFVVATSDGRPVACGGVQTIGDGIGEIKRMWVHPDWRGAGLGARLLRHLEQRCAELGHGVVRLDTNGTLTEAIAMYERAGYRPVPRYNDNPYAQAWFEKDLAEKDLAETGPGCTTAEMGAGRTPGPPEPKRPALSLRHTRGCGSTVPPDLWCHVVQTSWFPPVPRCYAQ